MRKHKCGC